MIDKKEFAKLSPQDRIKKLEDLEEYVMKMPYMTKGFYEGFLFALDQLLSLKHGITRLPGEEEVITRESFEKSWPETRKRILGNQFEV